MNKKRINGNYGGAIFAIIWCMFLGCMLLFASRFSTQAGFGIFPFFIIGGIMMLFGIGLFITSLKGAIMKSMILKNGKPGKGTIVETRMTSSKNGTYMYVTIEFETEDNNKALCEFIAHHNQFSFTKGKVIPIIQYKDMAIYDRNEDIDKYTSYQNTPRNTYNKNNDYFETKPKEEDDDLDANTGKGKIRCKHCNSLVPDNLLYCPKCFTSLEDEKNTCPNCSAELDEDSNFCPKCGYKLK